MLTSWTQIPAMLELEPYVLSQIQDGTEKVVAYGSSTLNKAERNYCVTYKELLEVRYFIEYFIYYLFGRRFTVQSDHQALNWIFSLREPKGLNKFISRFGCPLDLHSDQGRNYESRLFTNLCKLLEISE